MKSRADMVTNYVKVYRSLTKIPTINSGRILSGGHGEEMIKVTSEWSQRNLELGEITKFQKNFVVNTSTSKVVFDSSPVDITMQEMSRSSNTGANKCVVKKIKEEKKKKQFIEIWTQGGLMQTFDVAAIDAHGEIYCDVEFGSLEWSPNEEKVLYIAEKKRKKPEPFYKQKSVDTKSEDESMQGEEYTYRPDWGEQLVDKHQSVVVICDLKTETLNVLRGFPENLCPGQVIWSKDGTGIFGVAFDSDPRRLGLVYCTNRVSSIFHMTLNGDFKILSEPNKSVRSPRLSPDGKNLFWLQRQVGGPHDGCQELVRLDLTGQKREVVIEITRTSGKTFSGLFLHELPKRCFSEDGTKLFFSSYNKFKKSSYYLDIATKTIRTLDSGDGSTTVLDVRGEFVLLSTDSLQVTPALKIMNFVKDMHLISLTESDVICPQSVFKELELQSKTGKHKFNYFNALFYGPSSKTIHKVPLVLNVHGGPHSLFLDSYSLDCNFLVKAGFAVLLVNYRGSTGVGQEGIDFLPGKISDTDVKDSYEALQSALKTFPYLDEKNVFLYGGSHGGFLVEHLSAQYPDAFRAAVARNPVVSLPAMYHMSDIPDWAMSESDLTFDETKPLGVETNQKLLNASPINFCDRIKIPTLFLIGKNDRRVPFFEGIKMYNCLKARRVKVRLNLYDDNHALGSVPNHIDGLINAALWFHENGATSDPPVGVPVN